MENCLNYKAQQAITSYHCQKKSVNIATVRVATVHMFSFFFA